MVGDYGPYQDAAAPDIEWDIRTCVVRFPPSTVAPAEDGTFTTGGPYIHTNTNHVSVGVISVAITNSGELVVTNDGGTPIGAVHVSCDETLTERGIDAGPSGGGTTTRFRFRQEGVGYLSLNTQTGWDHIAGDTSNVWLTWLSPRVRSMRRPPLSDRIDQLHTHLTQIARHVPGSVARFNRHWDSFTVAAITTTHEGDSIAAINAHYEYI